MTQLKITLRAARVNRGYTMKDVAYYCNCSADTIWRYERDSTKMPRHLIVMLLDLYDVSFDDIFFGKETDFTESHKRKQQGRPTYYGA